MDFIPAEVRDEIQQYYDQFVRDDDGVWERAVEFFPDIGSKVCISDTLEIIWQEQAICILWFVDYVKDSTGIDLKPLSDLYMQVRSSDTTVEQRVVRHILAVTRRNVCR